MLTIAIKPSRMLAAILAIMHLLSLALVWIMPFSIWASVTISVMIMISAYHSFERDVLLRLQESIIALQLHSDCRCELQVRQGDWVGASLLGTTFVTPFLTVLNFKLLEQRFARHVVLLPDSLDNEQFRQLRVLLKWKCNRPQMEENVDC